MTGNTTAAPAPGVQQLPAMGWYPTPDGNLRRWDGQRWTGMRVRDGVTKADWATTDQPGAALALGSGWVALGFAQVSIGVATRSALFVAGICFLVLAVVWFVMAAAGYAVQRIPAPATQPATPDVVRPLPGEQEAADAGWYPGAGQVSRWWTGARWAEYTGSKIGVRPTFGGRRSYALVRGISWTVLVLGGIAMVTGLILALVVGWEFAWVVLVGAGILVLVGALLLAVVVRAHRRTLLLPSAPPAGLAPTGG